MTKSQWQSRGGVYLYLCSGKLWLERVQKSPDFGPWGISWKGAVGWKGAWQKKNIISAKCCYGKDATCLPAKHVWVQPNVQVNRSHFVCLEIGEREDDRKRRPRLGFNFSLSLGQSFVCLLLVWGKDYNNLSTESFNPKKVIVYVSILFCRVWD